MSAKAAPVGGRVTTPVFVACVALGALAALLLLWRFAAGLGATTAMNDGYPWGLWIAWDVIVGTALATGGYAMAILVYVFNRGRYHPLVRSALVTSALGYTMAGFSVVMDLGRWWHTWRIPVSPLDWNGQSVLLEVALCVMLYTAVLWVELAPIFLERMRASDVRAPLRALAERATRPLERALPWIIALGVLLPTMHQSSLGALLLLAGAKVHPLWQTPFLPLLFLLTALGMGWGAVVIESVLASVAFRRPLELSLLSELRRPALVAMLGYAIVRLADVVWRGQLGAALALDARALGFWLEIALVLVPAWMLATARPAPRPLFRAAVLLVTGGVLYRFSTFLIAFDPGRGYRYFPSVTEILITVGVIAGEVAGYLWIVRRLPILQAPEPTIEAVPAPPPGTPGVPTVVPRSPREGIVQ
jgi:Ni/Fe-hydrogenase subunit HybB-like protein